MKKIDRLLVQSFIPPFFVTFMIAIFVLVMQTLWLYIDDIAGKGLGMFMILELLAYKSVVLIPMALPLAILISSVMVLGNMAEKYELSSFKSAGVALLRVMRPLIALCSLIAVFSYFCSSTLIPIANLEFGARMYDIQRQKPTLRLDEGVFNDDFSGYTIHIGEKVDDKKIKDVIIYDQREANQGRVTQIIAEHGEMFSTEGGDYFVMNLYNGHKYIETNPVSGKDNNSSLPFIRTKFKQWEKVFDLSEFQLARTNTELFKGNRAMMSIKELGVAADSMDLKILQRRKSLANQISPFFSIIPLDSTFLKIDRRKDTLNIPETLKDSIGENAHLKNSTKKLINKKINEKPTKQKEVKGNEKQEGIQYVFAPDVNRFEQFIEDQFPEGRRNQLWDKAVMNAKNIKNYSESAITSLDRLAETQVKFIYELNTKYSMAMVCIIFLFIGAPMGAIVRKGGFGYPILVSIIFFIVFVILTIFCKKIAESFVVPAAVSAWIPCMVLAPIGAILTSKAMRDSKLLNLDQYIAAIKKLFSKKQKKETSNA